VTDVGSGAGLPGLVLALHRPDLRVVLVEPMQRRVTFLEETVEALGLARVIVVRSRAEEPAALRAAGNADVVTARALAPLDRLVTWCLPLARQGGQLLALKGAQAEAELEAARPALNLAGGVGATVHRVGAGVVDPPTVVVRVVRGDGAQQDEGQPRARRPRSTSGRSRAR
jgi:16S rRNA (guanine527-N7)-methyltransferase